MWSDGIRIEQREGKGEEREKQEWRAGLGGGGNEDQPLEKPPNRSSTPPVSLDARLLRRLQQRLLIVPARLFSIFIGPRMNRAERFYWSFCLVVASN